MGIGNWEWVTELFLSFNYIKARIITYNSPLPCNLLSSLLPSAFCHLPYCHRSVSIQPNLILGAQSIPRRALEKGGSKAPGQKP
ncbi:MAG: hypothetical protein F6K47_11505 [Symploca sp. SIO2E6]|nr:hypothetical protein [Symploca sp. SIO2E6]